MAPELASAEKLSMKFDIPSVWTEAMVLIENLDLPFYLIDKAGVHLEIAAANKGPTISIDQELRSITVVVSLVNKGMSDARDIVIEASISDGDDVIIASAIVLKLARRSSVDVTLRFENVSDRALSELSNAETSNNFDSSKIGLPVSIELATSDGYSLLTT